MAEWLEIHPLILHEHHVQRLTADNPAVEWFYLYQVSTVGRASDNAKMWVIREFPAAYFRGILKALDEMQVSPDILVIDAASQMVDLLFEKFGMISNFDIAKTVIKYWAETYSLFHPGEQQ